MQVIFWYMSDKPDITFQHLAWPLPIFVKFSVSRMEGAESHRTFVVLNPNFECLFFLLHSNGHASTWGPVIGSCLPVMNYSSKFKFDFFRTHQQWSWGRRPRCTRGPARASCRWTRCAPRSGQAPRSRRNRDTTPLELKKLIVKSKRSTYNFATVNALNAECWPWINTEREWILKWIGRNSKINW